MTRTCLLIRLIQRACCLAAVSVLATGVQPQSSILVVAALAVELKFGVKTVGAWLGIVEGIAVTVGECDAEGECDTEGAGLVLGPVEGFEEMLGMCVIVGDCEGGTDWSSGMHAFS